MSEQIKIPYATANLRYSRWERLHYRLLGYWPQSVVNRRLAADDIDEANARQHWLNVRRP